jgi:hypothetical protein
MRTKPMPKLDYREKCLAQKINVCVACGTSDELIVHHIDGDRENDRLENLVPVCHSCHSQIHLQPDPSGEVKRLQDKLPHEVEGLATGRQHPAFADSDRERASVYIQKSRLNDLDRLVDRSVGSNDSRSQQFRNASEAWVRVHRVLRDAGIERTDAETVELIEGAVRERVSND